MRVSLDGGVTFVKAPEGVRVIYDKINVAGEDEDGEVHVNHTHEGMIVDVWVSRDNTLDHNIGTSSETVEELAARLVEDGN